jgi:hypothetical protein
MSPSDLEELFELQPTRPLRITLSSGDQVILERPDLARVFGFSLIFGVGYEAGSRVSQRMRIISVPNIAMIEPVPRRNGTRRRRR